MKTLGLVVVTVLALLLPGTELTPAAEVGWGRPDSGSCCELAKLELWGKANLGFVRKSATTWEDGGLQEDDTGLLEVSRTTRVSTFSTGPPLKASEAGRVEDLAEGFGGRFENEGGEIWGDLTHSGVSTASWLDVTLSTLFVSLGELSSC